MSRIYALGIIFLVLALNIPEVSGDIRNKITFYDPIIRQRIALTRNVAEPALTSILRDLERHIQNGTINISQEIDTSDTWSLNHRPSITAEQFDQILRDYNSPAAGAGVPVTEYSKNKQIDNAYVLYIFIHESTAGTNANWNAETKNVGNIICAGYHSCVGRFRKYETWEEGFRAVIDLLVNYREEGITAIDTAIEKWAPPVENNTSKYITDLKENVSKWRKANAGQFVATSQQVGDKTIISAPALQTSDAKATLYLSGCLADTVPNALYPSSGLQDFIIPANGEWSFNENWTIVNENAHYCSGVPYGGVCDMASRYHLAAKELGLTTIYERHPGGLLGVQADDAVVIWSSGSRGGQDLIIVNKTNKAARFNAVIQNNELVVTAKFI